MDDLERRARGILDSRRPADADEFWDLSKLLPRKKTVPRAELFSQPTETRGTPAAEREVHPSTLPTVGFPFGQGQNAGGQGKLISEETFVMPESSLITQVVVEKRDIGVSFYGSFRTDALRLYNERGEKGLDYVPFFSYVPQYSQLNEAQLAYYLSWREAFRAHEYQRLDEGYFRLYVYEILNLPDLVTPSDGLFDLCRLWREYRSVLPHVDRYMVRFITDYCLLYRLPCPISLLQGVLDDVLKITDLPEFFLSESAALTDDGVLLLISMFSSYRWQSRAAAKGNEAFFERHITGAMRPVFRHLYKKYIPIDSERVAKKTLHVFSGAVAALPVRIRLFVTYFPFSFADGLKNATTNAVKYIENKLRASLGVRNRLRTDWQDSTLEKDLCALIDDYCRQNVAEMKKETPPAIPSYEKLYDAPTQGVSWESAEKIEARSWQTTRRLTEDADRAEGEDASFFLEEPPLYEKMPACASEEQADGLSETAFHYLMTFLREGGASAKKAAAKCGVTEESCIEEINLAFEDRYGDILFYPTGDGYALSEDYRTEVLEWIRTKNDFAFPSEF